MNKKSHENKKVIYLFGVSLSILMMFGMAFESFMPRGGFLRSLNEAWSDFRVNSPLLVYALFSGKEDKNPFTYSFGSLINKPGDPRIVIAAIDNHTLNNLGYPFQRKYYGAMIENLNRLGAKVIIMDVFTVDPDRSHPESDAEYIRAVKRAGNVVSSMAYDRWNKTFQLPIKGLGAASRIVAIPNMDKGLSPDNKVRNVFLFDPDGLYQDANTPDVGRDAKAYAGINLAGLSPAAYSIYFSTALPEVWARFGTEPYSLNFRYPVVRKSHPGWSKENLTEFSVYRWVSVLDIIQGKLSEDERKALKGAIVFVGSTAIGAYDHYPSPFMPNMPGVEVHANVLDNMLNQDFLRPINAWMVAFFVLLLIWLPIYLRKYSVTLISSVVAFIVVLAVLLDYYLLHRVYNFMFAHIAVAVLFPFVFVAVHKALVEGREKRWIKNTFGQYLSPKVVDLITKDPSKLSLGGEKRDMTAFFLDLAGFTTMSEKLTPEELTSMLNEYLSAFTEIILKHDGTVDKYIGDCIVAFWNAPLDQADHRKLGVMAAVDCQVEMARLNKALTQFTIKPACRVGVNSGPMVVGNMGSKTRLSYTVMGDSVNLASRLEGANKFFHSRIMTSEATFGDLKDLFDHRYLGSVLVVGKAIPVKVYEPFARKGEAAPEVLKMLERFNAGQAKFFAGKYADSVKDFKAALEVLPGDGPSQFYLETAAQYAKEPPKDWNGSFNITSKG
ncbi:MAG: adenylate/guanylate cyclase domain-containing protein [Elusimicrobiales bacterium]|nr:adenylate/guanylate cyclase domain-containing protein [Elusimicrobiales bacterium]